MKVLFIGGTGNISTDCAALLHEHGHEISVVSRGRTSVPSEYHAVQVDRKDPAALRAALEGVRPDVVINFLGFELADVRVDHEIFREKISQYIFISSATVYAKPPTCLPIREDAPMGNVWWDYASQKLECERWLQERWADGRFPVTIVRPSHTYSKLWVPNPVSSSSYTFAARLEQGRPVFVPDDGETPWTLTATADFAVGLAGLVGKAEAVGEAFHITSDEALTWNQIYGEIAAALGVDSPEVVKIPTEFICRVVPRLTGSLKGDKAHPAVFDNSKIKRLVPGFVCRTPFSEGIRASVKWLRSHPEGQHLSSEIEAEIDRVMAAWRRGEG